MNMERNNLKQIERFARGEGYEEVIINVNQKKPMTIEGIKGRFTPEVLCYAKEKLEAFITTIQSILDEQEFYKLTLFMDYCRKNHLHLYVMYNEQQFSKDKIVEKMAEFGIVIPENLGFIAMNQVV